MGNTYVIRIYRGERGDPESLVGIVEDVQSEEKKRFAGLEELGNVLSSFHESDEIIFRKEKEKRMAPRINSQIPLFFIRRKGRVKGSILNYSPHGLGVAVNAKSGLSIGSVLHIEAGESSAKAEIRWVRKKSAAGLLAGCRIISGQCRLDSLETDAAITVTAVKN